MEITYDPQVDMLGIILNAKLSRGAKEVAPGVVMDFDEDGRVIAIEIEHASQFTDVSAVAVKLLKPTQVK